MLKPRRLVAIHRIGYVTTALVAAEALWLLCLAVPPLWRQQVRERARVADTSYVAGPLRGPDYLLHYMVQLPPLERLGPDSLRFVAYPELAGTTYMLALRHVPRANFAEGLLIIQRQSPQKPTTTERRSLRFAVSDYNALTSRIDQRLEGATGSTGFDTDGTDIAFERRRETRVTSGGGNTIEPYRTAGEDVLAFLRRTKMASALPRANTDWYQQ